MAFERGDALRPKHSGKHFGMYSVEHARVASESLPVACMLDGRPARSPACLPACLPAADRHAAGMVVMHGRLSSVCLSDTEAMRMHCIYVCIIEVLLSTVCTYVMYVHERMNVYGIYSFMHASRNSFRMTSAQIQISGGGFASNMERNLAHINSMFHNLSYMGSKTKIIFLENPTLLYYLNGVVTVIVMMHNKVFREVQ
jgi:hypothetical protein